MVVSIDNTPIGPGEYSPPLRPHVSRHISTPKLGSRHNNSLVDMHHPFRSNISRGGNSPTGIIRGKEMTPYSIANEISISSNMDLSSFQSGSKSMYNDHDRKQPYIMDERVMTPSTYLGYEDILFPKSTYGGKTKVQNIVIEKALRALNPTRAAGPSYFPLYESTEKRLQAAVIPDGERFSYNKKRKKKKPRKEVEIPYSKRPMSPWRQQKLQQKLLDNSVQYGGESSVLSITSTLSAERAQSPNTSSLNMNNNNQDAKVAIFKPKLGSRAARFGAVPKFDASTYDRTKKPRPLTISPGTLSKEIKADLFMKFLTARREPRFKPKGVPSLVGDKLKRHALG